MPEVIKISDADDLIPTSEFKYANWPFDELNPVQSKVYEIYNTDCNAAIASSTASGKTVCAEMFMSYEVRVKKGKAIYIAPMKSLAKEKEQDWTDPDHHFFDLKIEIVTGDYRLTSTRIEQLNKADIIVMTPEMLASRSRNSDSDKSNFLKDVSVVVFDESHLLTVPSRGDHIEVALMKLTEFNKKARVVMLSATMPNVDEICGWVTDISGRDTYYLESDYRPCPLHIHYEDYYDGDRNYDDRELQKIAKASSIIDYYPDDKFVVFSHTKRTGKQMVDYLEKQGIKSEFHNADLTLKDRLRIEEEFKSKDGLRVVIATSTLAWGNNMPSRRVIILGVHRGLSVVENYDIKQMCGRAGRPKYDPRGDAYILVPESEKDVWVDKLRQNCKIKSTLLEFVGKLEDPRYKTLAFHVVSEIHQGNVTNIEAFKEWSRRSLAHFQSHDFGDRVIESTVKLLEQCRAIKTNEDGQFETTNIGKIASMYYYSPFDVADLRSNFAKLFEAGQENNDYASSLALANVDSNRWAIVNRTEKAKMSAYDQKVQREIGGFMTSGSVKFGYAYFNMLKGRKDATFSALQSGLMADMDRQFQVLHTINQMASKWGKETWFKTFRMRLLYGVEADLVDLIRIPNVGAVRAKRLKAKGIKSVDQFLKKTPDSLASIMNCGKKVAKEAFEGAQNIKLQEMM